MEFEEGVGGGAIRLLTKNLWNKATKKNRQLQEYAMPRVLSVVSSHVGASVLINSATALWAFTSEEFYIHEIGTDKADPNRYADLENSLFLETHGRRENCAATERDIRNTFDCGRWRC